MTTRLDVTPIATWVAIDIAKHHHAVLIETPDGRHRRFRLASTLEDYQRLIEYLQAAPQPVRIAMEPTGDYHRTLAHRLVSHGLDVCLVSSVAGARFREAMYNSWDKNDPKDAGVILALLKQGMTHTVRGPADRRASRTTGVIQNTLPDQLGEDSPTAQSHDSLLALVLS